MIFFKLISILQLLLLLSTQQVEAQPTFPPPPPPPPPPRSIEDIWGDAGAVAYPAAANIMGRRNGSSVQMDERSKNYLRPWFGDLVDRVVIVWNALPIEKWEAFGKSIVLSGVEAYGQTYCDRIYIQDSYRFADKAQLTTLAHELAHTKQCHDLGGEKKFGWHYFHQYKKGGENYWNIQLEKDAYDLDERFERRYEEQLAVIRERNLNRGCIRKVAFRTPNDAFYVRAVRGGHGTVRADAQFRRDHELFHLVDLNCGTILSGDRINLIAPNGMYVVAENGGGSVVNANRENAAAWEEFVIQSATGGRITNNSQVTIKSTNNQFWSAQNGGGGELNANRSNAQEWEQFTILIYP